MPFCVKYKNQNKYNYDSLQQIKDPENVMELTIFDEKEMTIIPEDALWRFTNLEIFTIRDNPNLTTIPELLLRKNVALQYFSCAYNASLTALPESLFQNAFNLTHFFLAGSCRMETLPKMLFQNNTNLREFWCINFFKLKQFPDDLFENNKDLRQVFFINNTALTRLPSSVMGCTRLRNLHVFNSPLEHNTPQMIRFVERIQNQNITSSKATIYDDNQNVHNVAVHKSARKSISSIVSTFHTSVDDKELFQKIFGNVHFSQKTIDIIADFLQPENDHVHSTLLIKFSELLNAVLNFISTQPEAIQKTIFCILNQEIQSSDCVCYSGRIIRTINAISGFTELVDIQISDSQQIAYVALLAREMYPSDVEKQREHFVNEMRHRKYPEDTIQVWLEGFDADEKEE